MRNAYHFEGKKKMSYYPVDLIEREEINIATSSLVCAVHWCNSSP